MPLTSPGNDDDTGENHQPTLRKNTAEPVEQTLKQNTWSLISHAHSDSKSRVNRLPGSAHGTDATTTPHPGQSTRGIMATSSTRQQPKSR